MPELQLWDAAPGALGSSATDAPGLSSFPVDGGDRRPAIVVFPGGAYHHHAAHEGEPVARWLNSLGVAAFVLRYRVAPYRYPVPLWDAARAVRYVRHHAERWNVDASRVGVLGFSAGGHLAGLLATETGAAVADGTADAVDAEDATPGVAVLCYPVADLAGPSAHEGSAANLLGPAPDGAIKERLSLRRRVSRTSPPMFLWHTADDELSVDNSLGVARALAVHGVPVELHVYPHGRHGLGLAADDEVVGGWTRAAGTFLRGQGWGAKLSP